MEDGRGGGHLDFGHGCDNTRVRDLRACVFAALAHVHD